MAYYLSKYIGKYRLLTEYDLHTNNFAKDLNGTYETGDVYIKCAKGNKITYWGRGILVAYVPSIIRGKNILKAVGERNGIDLSKYQIEQDDIKRFDFDNYLKELLETKIIFDIEESDEELLWKFKNKYTELMAELLGASTYGAKRSPFSPKNLPIAEYDIPDEDLKKYKDVINNLDQSLVIKISHVTKAFYTEYIPKKHKEYRKVDMTALMRLKKLKAKEFIHSIGFWDEYIAYLQKHLKDV